MPLCASCKSVETELWSRGIPLCLECAEKGQMQRKPPASVKTRIEQAKIAK